MKWNSINWDSLGLALIFFFSIFDVNFSFVPISRMYFYQYVRLDTKRMILSSILIQYLYLIPRFYLTRVIDDYLDDNEWKFRINLIKKIE